MAHQQTGRRWQPDTGRDCAARVHQVIVRLRVVADPEGDPLYHRSSKWPDVGPLAKPGARGGLRNVVNKQCTAYVVFVVHASLVVHDPICLYSDSIFPPDISILTPIRIVYKCKRISRSISRCVTGHCKKESVRNWAINIAPNDSAPLPRISNRMEMYAFTCIHTLLHHSLQTSPKYQLVKVSRARRTFWHICI